MKYLFNIVLGLYLGFPASASDDSPPAPRPGLKLPRTTSLNDGLNLILNGSNDYTTSQDLINQLHDALGDRSDGDSDGDDKRELLIDPLEIIERPSNPELEDFPSTEEGPVQPTTISDVNNLTFARNMYLNPCRPYKAIALPIGERLECFTKDSILNAWGEVFPVMLLYCREGNCVDAFVSTLQEYPELAQYALFAGRTLLFHVIRCCRNKPTDGVFNNMSNRLLMIKILMKAGADPNAIVCALEDVFDDHDDDSEDDDTLTYESLLTLACRVGNAQMVGLLIYAGADLEFRDDDGLNPLHHAATNKTHAIEVIKLLLAKGVNARVLCPLWGSALQLAQNEYFDIPQREAVVDLLTQHEKALKDKE